MPQLLDPNFRRAVVLLVHHDEDGTFGVVLNRVTEISALHLCSSIDIDWSGNPEAEIHWGGPVQPQTGWILLDEEEAPLGLENARNLAPGVTFAGSLDVLRRVASDPPERLRVMLGYAGWGGGQLELELAQGAWLVVPVVSEMIFDVDVDEMWAQAVRSLGIEPATLVSTPGIH